MSKSVSVSRQSYAGSEDDYNEVTPSARPIIQTVADRSFSWIRSCRAYCNESMKAHPNLSKCISALAPSFLTTQAATTPSKSGIAALDGLRGLACLFVFNEHYVICYQSRESQAWIMRVPLIRLFWYGKAAVFVFFAISGYVLSHKPLKLLAEGSHREFGKVISSSCFRRPIRLYLPCLIVSFIICLLTNFGLFDQSFGIFFQYSDFIYLKEEPPLRMNLWSQLSGYFRNVDFIFSGTIPFDKDTDIKHYFVYDEHQWSIPQEFRCSMVVFGLLVTTSRMRGLLRMLTFAALTYYSIRTRRWYMALFLAGMLCAEIDIFRQASSTRKQLSGYTDQIVTYGSGVSQHLPGKAAKGFWIGLFSVGVYMISSPQELQHVPNFLPSLLSSWGVSDVDDTLLLFGAICIVWSVASCPSLGPIFNNPVVCYLGKISYALYLVHGSLIKSLGYRILPWTLCLATGTPADFEWDIWWWQAVPDRQKVLAYLIGCCIIVPTCFWLSDLFWRFVDIPCVSFARKIESWVTENADIDGSIADLQPISKGD